MSESGNADDDLPYEVDWSAMALRRLDRLPEKVAAAIVEFVHGALTANPYRVGKRLDLDYAGSMSARRGPYRIIYEIDDDARVVTIETVGHRSDVYRPR